ncbi:MAG TPA: Uma2 family endonuclease [Gemmatimonadales bacterium]
MPLLEYLTADAVRRMPDDGNRYEVVHGELLVTPAPAGRHQLVLANIFRAVDGYLTAHGIREALWSPADISFGDDTLVQPDLFVADLDAFRQSSDWRDIRTLHLVVEALSPSSLRADRFTKRRLYQEQRIGTYWVVDVDQQQVEVWTPDLTFPIIEREQLVWRHPALVEACSVSVPGLFQ